MACRASISEENERQCISHTGESHAHNMACLPTCADTLSDPVVKKSISLWNRGIKIDELGHYFDLLGVRALAASGDRLVVPGCNRPSYITIAGPELETNADKMRPGVIMMTYPVSLSCNNRFGMQHIMFRFSGIHVRMPVSFMLEKEGDGYESFELREGGVPTCVFGMQTGTWSPIFTVMPHQFITIHPRIPLGTSGPMKFKIRTSENALFPEGIYSTTPIMLCPVADEVVVCPDFSGYDDITRASKVPTLSGEVDIAQTSATYLITNREAVFRGVGEYTFTLFSQYVEDGDVMSGSLKLESVDDVVL